MGLVSRLCLDVIRRRFSVVGGLFRFWFSIRGNLWRIWGELGRIIVVM